MIKENQQLLNRINILSDALIIYLMIPVSFWIRFTLRQGVVNVTLRDYMILGLFYTAVQIALFYAVGLYRPYRHVRLRRELARLLLACMLGFTLLISWLSLRHMDDYSRQMLLIFFLLSVFFLSLKRFLLRQTLWRLRERGFNLKHVLLIGSGSLARTYLDKIETERNMGYHPLGYIAEKEGDLNIPYLGSYDVLEKVLEEKKPDEVVSAVDPAEFSHTPEIVDACEKTGCKLSAIPIYAEYMSSSQQIDDLDGIPLLAMRRLPLENLGNAFLKRTADILLSALILTVFSPVMLIIAIGVKLSSPGPVIFAQKRIGRNKEPFMMYKFRSMRVNTTQDTAWSSTEDSRKTAFGSFIRKYSLDEFPQFWNVLKGDMSLVGPRPEIPYFVDQFKEKVPRYMLKHLVRPGITGWAQVNDLRGDTSIPERIKYDIYYIEHWSVWFDLKILFLTVFGGKFKNSEKLNK
ncbi:MAG: undecaprenyl-phosphate glucose phosphotransferase [Oscillospiraceae bacterium]|nr:undecaprenyl-phosphate glucose phosphotransferase [Oscillospiraceae bacterium]